MTLGREAMERLGRASVGFWPKCRVCGSDRLTEVLTLGEQYVSGFPSSPEDLKGWPKVPITLDLCGRCTLVQQRYTAPQEILYRRHYWYRSGTTQTMRDSLAEIAGEAVKRAGLVANDIVLDIGSNDGTLLRSYPRWVHTIGFEPAVNLTREGSQGICRLIPDFWSFERWCEHVHPSSRAKVVTAIGMFYDLDDPNTFIRDVARVLAPDGLFVAQLMCLRQTVENNDVGNLCHEHLEFYSLRSLEFLLSKHGLKVEDLERNEVNGGSYRLYIRHTDNAKLWPEDRDPVLAAWKQEYNLGLDVPDRLKEWFGRMGANRDRCVDFIRQEVARGKRVWIYGASTKGNVIAQWYGLNREYRTKDGLLAVLIEAAADRSPEKWGKLTVTGIPIVAERAFRKVNPEYAIVMPYGFLPEFVAREREWLEKGGKFIVPLPEFKVVGKEALP